MATSHLKSLSRLLQSHSGLSYQTCFNLVSEQATAGLLDYKLDEQGSKRAVVHLLSAVMSKDPGALMANSAVLLVGAPGAGKTTLAKCAPKERYIYLDPKTLKLPIAPADLAPIDWSSQNRHAYNTWLEGVFLHLTASSDTHHLILEEVGLMVPKDLKNVLRLARENSDKLILTAQRVSYLPEDTLAGIPVIDLDLLRYPRFRA